MKKFLRWVPLLTFVLAITFTVVLCWKDGSVVKANDNPDIDFEMYSFDNYADWYDKYASIVNGDGITLTPTQWDDDLQKDVPKYTEFNYYGGKINMKERVDYRKLANCLPKQAPCRYWFWVKKNHQRSTDLFWHTKSFVSSDSKISDYNCDSGTNKMTIKRLDGISKGESFLLRENHRKGFDDFDLYVVDMNDWIIKHWGNMGRDDSGADLYGFEGYLNTVAEKHNAGAGFRVFTGEYRTMSSWLAACSWLEPANCYSHYNQHFKLTIPITTEATVHFIKTSDKYPGGDENANLQREHTEPDLTPNTAINFDVKETIEKDGRVYKLKGVYSRTEVEEGGEEDQDGDGVSDKMDGKFYVTTRSFKQYPELAFDNTVITDYSKKNGTGMGKDTLDTDGGHYKGIATVNVSKEGQWTPYDEKANKELPV